MLALALGSLTEAAAARVAVPHRATSARRVASARRATAHRPVSARDRAATHAYLQAEYEFELAVNGVAPQSRAAVEALPARLGGECPGVLAGAPAEEPLLGLLRPPGGSRPSAKARGEADRTSRQRSALEGELTISLFAAAFQLEEPAIAKLTAALTPLRWSDPRIAIRIDADLALISSVLAPRVPNVCADMRSWVASGYRRLSAGTKEFVRQQAARTSPPFFAASVETLLKRYEGPADRTLIRRTKALERGQLVALLSLLRLGTKLRAAVGLKPEFEEVTDLGTRVGGGRTRDGGRYTVRVRAPVAILHGPRCRHEVLLEYSRRRGSAGIFSGSAGPTSCLPGPGPSQPPTVACQQGDLRVTTRVLSKTRSVRLQLSDGSSVRSPVIAIPRRLGGPARFYLQSLRGPAPFPVSLTELDARGRTLRVVRLPLLRHCRKVAVSPPTLKTIVHATAPGGARFTITGFSFRFGRQREFSLSSDARESGGFLSGIALSEEGRPARPAILAQVGLEASCSSHPFTIVYGWLKVPGASVLAQTPAGLVTLAKAKIPTALHAKGVVAYGAFPTPPTALVVRAPGGRTLAREDLSRRAVEQNEYCEGYAET